MLNTLCLELGGITAIVTYFTSWVVVIARISDLLKIRKFRKTLDSLSKKEEAQLEKELRELPKKELERIEEILSKPFSSRDTLLFGFTLFFTFLFFLLAGMYGADFLDSIITIW